MREQHRIRQKNNISKHVQARKGIVEHTSKGTYKWGVNSSINMNSRYWQQSRNGRWGAKPGVSLEDASKDVFKNPSGFDYMPWPVKKSVPNRHRGRKYHLYRRQTVLGIPEATSRLTNGCVISGK